MTTNLTVANTINAQLGRACLMMLGAKNLIGSEDSLQFKIGRNAKGVTHVTIRLDPSDTYTVTFNRVRGLKVTLVSETSDVYADALRRVIEAATGLYTSI